MGVRASAEALLMLRGEFKVFLLCVDGNVFVASRWNVVYFGKIVPKKNSYIVYTNDWQI